MASAIHWLRAFNEQADRAAQPFVDYNDTIRGLILRDHERGLRQRREEELWNRDVSRQDAIRAQDREFQVKDTQEARDFTVERARQAHKDDLNRMAEGIRLKEESAERGREREHRGLAEIYASETGTPLGDALGMTPEALAYAIEMHKRTLDNKARLALEGDILRVRYEVESEIQQEEMERAAGDLEATESEIETLVKNAGITPGQMEEMYATAEGQVLGGLSEDQAENMDPAAKAELVSARFQEILQAESGTTIKQAQLAALSDAMRRRNSLLTNHRGLSQRSRLNLESPAVETDRAVTYEDLMGGISDLTQDPVAQQALRNRLEELRSQNIPVHEARAIIQGEARAGGVDTSDAPDRSAILDSAPFWGPAAGVAAYQATRQIPNAARGVASGAGNLRHWAGMVTPSNPLASPATAAAAPGLVGNALRVAGGIGAGLTAENMMGHLGVDDHAAAPWVTGAAGTAGAIFAKPALIGAASYGATRGVDNFGRLFPDSRSGANGGNRTFTQRSVDAFMPEAYGTPASLEFRRDIGRGLPENASAEEVVEFRRRQQMAEMERQRAELLGGGLRSPY